MGSAVGAVVAVYCVACIVQFFFGKRLVEINCYNLCTYEEKSGSSDGMMAWGAEGEVCSVPESP